jgi:hypothetical protein
MSDLAGTSRGSRGPVVNTQTGASYAFVTTTTPITAADLQNLPSGTVIQGAEYPEQMPYTMNVLAINSSGTAIGSIPNEGDLTNPWNNPTLGYAVRSSDGQYSPFVPLIPYEQSLPVNVAVHGAR